VAYFRYLLSFSVPVVIFLDTTYLASSCNALYKYYCLHFQHEVTLLWPLPRLTVHIHHSSCILTNLEWAQQGPWKRHHISWRQLPSECRPLSRLILDTVTQKQYLQIRSIVYCQNAFCWLDNFVTVVETTCPAVPSQAIKKNSLLVMICNCATFWSTQVPKCGFCSKIGGL
jgi:hypothetical protein